MLMAKIKKWNKSIQYISVKIRKRAKSIDPFYLNTNTA
jgi:hypothetical protein